jgi:CHAD domain-containing protein
VLLAMARRVEMPPSGHGNGNGPHNGATAGASPLDACREQMAFDAASMVWAASGKKPRPLNHSKDAPGTKRGVDHVQSQIAVKLAAVLEIADRLARAEAASSGARSPADDSRPATSRKSPHHPKAQPLRIVSMVDDQHRLTVCLTGSCAVRVAKSANLPSIWTRAIFRPIHCLALTAKAASRLAAQSDSTGRGWNFCGNTEFAQAGRIIIQRQIEHILTRRYAAGYLCDPEYVHEMRVATRRMRAAIRVFEDVLELGRLKTEVAHLADVLGQARDLDVFLEFLRQYRDGCEGVRRAFTDEMIASWSVRRRASYRKVQAMMNSAALGAFLTHAHKSFALPVGAAGGPRPTSAGWKEPLWREARAILHRELRKMFRYESDLKRYSPRRRHRLRIAGKRMRYLSEFFMPLYGRPMAELIDHVKDVQACLGDSHDCEVFIDHVRQYVKSRSDGVADKSRPLVRSLQQHGRRSVARAIKVWRKLRGRSNSQKFMRLVDSPKWK